jgi:hypothetical protein
VKADEISLVRNLYSLVLSYYLRFVRGGWHQLDDTANYFLLKTDQVGCCFIRYFFYMISLVVYVILH